MEVVNDMHAGQSQGGWSHVGTFWSTYQVRGDSLITPDYTDILDSSTGLGRV